MGRCPDRFRSRLDRGFRCRSRRPWRHRPPTSSLLETVCRSAGVRPRGAGRRSAGRSAGRRTRRRRFAAPRRPAPDHLGRHSRGSRPAARARCRWRRPTRRLHRLAACDLLHWLATCDPPKRRGRMDGGHHTFSGATARRPRRRRLPADAVGAGPHDTSATTTRYSLRAGWGPVFSAVEIFRVFSITPAHRLVYTSGGGLCHHCIYSLGKDTFENATAFTSLPSRRFTEGFPGCP